MCSASLYSNKFQFLEESMILVFESTSSVSCVLDCDAKNVLS
jgi:hypothetical protein